MWAGGYAYTSYSKTFLVLTLFSRYYTGIAQWPYITQRKFQKIQGKLDIFLQLNGIKS